MTNSLSEKNISREKYITISRYITLLAVATLAFYTVFFYFQGFQFLSLFSLVITFLLGASYYYVYRREIDISRTILISSAIVFVFGISASLPPESGISLLYFPLSCGIVILYSTKELRTVLIFLGFTIFSIFALGIPALADILPKSELAPQLLKIMQVTNFLLGIIVTLLCVLTLQFAGYHAEKVLISEQGKTKSILENTDDIIWLVDKRGNVIVMNKAATSSLYNWNGDKIKQDSKIRELGKYGFGTEAWWDQSILKTLAGQQLQEELTVTDGVNNFYFEIAFNPVFVEKHITGVGIFCKNITKKRLIDEELRLIAQEEKDRNWLNLGVSKINEIMRDRSDLARLSQAFINFVVEYVGASHAALYSYDNDLETLTFSSGYAFDARVHNSTTSYKKGEGLIGQVALENKPITLNHIPDDYLRVSSALGMMRPKSLYITPLSYENTLRGVMELAFVQEPGELQMQFIDQACRIAANISLALKIKLETEQLLRETQELNEKLSIQEEELKASNDELLEKTSRLEASEEELREQQEELLQTTAQLEEKAQQLEEQNESIGLKNNELEEATSALDVKAAELEAISQYKSEFLANMSHELRTPLNSILILSNLLIENEGRSISGKLMDYAQIIQRSGSDLLNLINDILDLSKIESRQMELYIEEVTLQDVSMEMENLFRETANNKKLSFQVQLEKNVPPTLIGDKMRIEQVVKNLLSNAIKFTPAQGKVALRIYRPGPEFKAHTTESTDLMCFEVADTGIGIPAEKQKLIFEAFQQADGSTSRTFGGTGLGLSISKELAYMMEGELQLSSLQDQGSVFTLVLPLAHSGYNKDELAEDPRASAPVLKKREPARPIPAFNAIKPQGKEKGFILIIEDDAVFSRLLADKAEENGFKPLTAGTGEEGLQKLNDTLPDAILLDVNLPGMDGWEVMRRIKDTPEYENIPVHIMSGLDGSEQSNSLGAVDFLHKPITSDKLREVFQRMEGGKPNKIKEVLFASHQANEYEHLQESLKKLGIICHTAFTAEGAIENLVLNDVDLLITSMELTDATAPELLKRIKINPSWNNIHLIVYSEKEMSEQDYEELHRAGSAVVMKSEKAYDRLMDETLLFFNSIDKANPEPAEISEEAPRKKEGLKGKKVLLVDDDQRNIIALSAALEGAGIEVVEACNGLESLQKLKENNDISLVLMDIMMPEMDGYEATKAIRMQSKYIELPIIALTAKAMSTDREKCLQAGASDYMSKPVNINKLLSLMQVWLAR